jgi:hypothetical protein
MQNAIDQALEYESPIILSNYELNCESQQPSKSHWQKQMRCHHSQSGWMTDSFQQNQNHQLIQQWMESQLIEVMKIEMKMQFIQSVSIGMLTQMRWIKMIYNRQGPGIPWKTLKIFNNLGSLSIPANHLFQLFAAVGGGAFSGSKQPRVRR